MAQQAWVYSGTTVHYALARHRTSGQTQERSTPCSTARANSSVQLPLLVLVQTGKPEWVHSTNRPSCWLTGTELFLPETTLENECFGRAVRWTSFPFNPHGRCFLLRCTPSRKHNCRASPTQKQLQCLLGVNFTFSSEIWSSRTCCSISLISWEGETQRRGLTPIQPCPFFDELWRMFKTHLTNILQTSRIKKSRKIPGNMTAINIHQYI